MEECNIEFCIQPVYAVGICRRHYKQVAHDQGKGFTELYVYFIYAPLVNKVKIGRATNLADRLQKIQTHSPIDVVLLGYIKGTKATELAIHHRFGDYRARGEWFEYAPPIQEFFERFATKVDEWAG